MKLGPLCARARGHLTRDTQIMWLVKKLVMVQVQFITRVYGTKRNSNEWKICMASCMTSSGQCFMIYKDIALGPGKWGRINARNYTPRQAIQLPFVGLLHFVMKYAIWIFHQYNSIGKESLLYAHVRMKPIMSYMDIWNPKDKVWKHAWGWKWKTHMLKKMWQLAKDVCLLD